MLGVRRDFSPCYTTNIGASDLVICAILLDHAGTREKVVYLSILFNTGVTFIRFYN